MIEIKLIADRKVIIETLQRCGVPIVKDKILFPSVYLFEHEGKSYLTHFKELFSIIKDDGTNDTSDSDYERLNSVSYLLCRWNLISIDDMNLIEPHRTTIFVLPYTDKKNWKISHKIKYFNKTV